MPCHNPIRGYRAVGGGFTTKRIGSTGTMSIPCGKCIGCRMDNSRDWAVRCVHESKMLPEEESCFITLTYSPENLPKHGTLVKNDFRKFMKRLRKKFPNNLIKYMMCGEYGEQNKRPHYHAILFGISFPDLSDPIQRKSGSISYNSKILEDTWGLGFTDIGTVTFESAAYVARYITKKVNGQMADLHYCTGQVDEDTGEIIKLQPEYAAHSNKPHPDAEKQGRGGLGYRYYEQYKHDFFNHGQIILLRDNSTFECRIPRYYRECYRIDHPERYEKYQKKLLEIHRERTNREERTSTEVLEIKNQLAEQRYEKLIRGYEQDEH